jgi:DnaJ family protein A protein 2
MFFGGHPFGGMPGGSGHGAPREEADTTKLYETLEVDKGASKKDIRKAYMKLSRTHHPDKGGDAHKFKEISAAYEILSDDDKRAQYDKYGLDGVSGDDVGAAGGEDLFSMFFGGGGRSRRSAGPRKGPSVNHPLKASLEDLYNGKTVKLAVNRKVIQGTPVECTRCKGQGAIVEIRQMGPGMITQMQRQCDQCGGQGQQCTFKSERKVSCRSTWCARSTGWDVVRLFNDLTWEDVYLSYICPIFVHLIFLLTRHCCIFILEIATI